MQKITPSEALVETLRMHDVKYVFGIVGSAYMDALDIFEGAGIKFIPVAHEQGAAHMADGYARISHIHGVCIAQNGPGITNFVTAIAAAYRGLFSNSLIPLPNNIKASRFRWISRNTKNIKPI